MVIHNTGHLYLKVNAYYIAKYLLIILIERAIGNVNRTRKVYTRWQEIKKKALVELLSCLEMYTYEF